MCTYFAVLPLVKSPTSPARAPDWRSPNVTLTRSSPSEEISWEPTEEMPGSRPAS